MAGGVPVAQADVTESIRLDYEASPGCPDEQAFVSLIRARTARARVVVHEETARIFRVKLAAQDRPSGTVTVIDGVHAAGARRVDAATCADAAEAMALIVALAVDPRALVTAQPPVASAPPGVESGDAPAASSAGTPAPVFAPAAPSSTAPTPALPLDPKPTVQEGSPASRTNDRPSQPVIRPLALAFFAGVDLAVTGGVTPTAIVAGAPYLGWRSTRAHGVGASLRLSFLRSGTGTLRVPGGAANFDWTVGRMDVCSILWPDASLRLGGCARVEAGLLDVTGEQIAAGRTQHGPWVAVGPHARLEWSFLGALVLDLEVGPELRIPQDRFYFLPGTTAYRVPLAGLSTEAGVGAHFL
jgi:hypothetical protein